MFDKADTVVVETMENTLNKDAPNYLWREKTGRERKTSLHWGLLYYHLHTVALSGEVWVLQRNTGISSVQIWWSTFSQSVLFICQYTHRQQHRWPCCQSGFLYPPQVYSIYNLDNWIFAAQELSTLSSCKFCHKWKSKLVFPVLSKPSAEPCDSPLL